MNIQAVIGYCCGVPYVMQDKLSQSLADDRSSQRMVLDHETTSNTSNMKMLLQQPQQQANATQQNASLARTLPTIPVSNTLSDMITRFASLPTTVPQQDVGLLAQIRMLMTGQAAPKMFAQLSAQIASLFYGLRASLENDPEEKNKRQLNDKNIEMTDSEAILALADVSDAKDASLGNG